MFWNAEVSMFSIFSLISSSSPIFMRLGIYPSPPTTNDITVTVMFFQFPDKVHVFI